MHCQNAVKVSNTTNTYPKWRAAGQEPILKAKSDLTWLSF